jgi:hypothetical protein
LRKAVARDLRMPTPTHTTKDAKSRKVLASFVAQLLVGVSAPTPLSKGFWHPSAKMREKEKKKYISAYYSKDARRMPTHT